MLKLTCAIALSIICATANAGVDQILSRSFGGKQTVELKEGDRLVNVTWKRDSLWILTKHDSTQKPQSYTFNEVSIWGVLEGEVLIVEK